MSTVTAEKYVVAWQPFSGPAGDVLRGERFRANDPLVLQAPKNFVDADMSQREWPTIFDRSIADAEVVENARENARKARELEQARANATKLETGLYRCTEEFVCHYHNAPTLILAGSVVHDRHELLHAYGERFFEPMPVKAARS